MGQQAESRALLQVPYRVLPPHRRVPQGVARVDNDAWPVHRLHGLLPLLLPGATHRATRGCEGGKAGEGVVRSASRRSRGGEARLGDVWVRGRRGAAGLTSASRHDNVIVKMAKLFCCCIMKRSGTTYQVTRAFGVGITV
mmetsp:Transcript_7924/g.28167  ORF Transcript_7924/g.28167 Transcript_7924/m.28167 type:complete len:140 (+) Transcript_7924:2595-3014(+)